MKTPVQGFKSTMPVSFRLNDLNRKGLFLVQMNIALGKSNDNTFFVEELINFKSNGTFHLFFLQNQMNHDPEIQIKYHIFDGIPYLILDFIPYCNKKDIPE